MTEEIKVKTSVLMDNADFLVAPVNDKKNPVAVQELTSAYSSTKITKT
jgi:hypothetical protein